MLGEKGSWKEAGLAALPNLVMGALLALSTLRAYLTSAGDGWWFALWTALIIGSTLAGLIIAVLRGFPRWAGGWYGYALLLAVSYVPMTLPGMDAMAFWNTPAYFQRALIQEVLLPLGILGAFSLIFYKDRISGLLMALPWMLYGWLLYLEFVPEGMSMVINLAAYLVIAVSAALIVCSKQLSSALWITVGTNAVLGVIFILAGHFLTVPQVRDRTLERILRDLLPELISGLALVVVPLLVLALWEMARRIGSGGKTGFWLVGSGALLCLAGTLASYRIFLPNDLDRPQPAAGFWLAWIIATGIFLICGGAIWMVSAAWRSGKHSQYIVILPIILLLLVSPLLYMLPNVLATMSIPALAPLREGLVSITGFQVVWGYALGMAWLAMSILQVGREYSREA